MRDRNEYGILGGLGSAAHHSATLRAAPRPDTVALYRQHVDV